jgi:hypothetical protein
MSAAIERAMLRRKISFNPMNRRLVASICFDREFTWRPTMSKPFAIIAPRDKNDWPVIFVDCLADRWYSLRKSRD